MIQIDKILVAVDFSKESTLATKFAISMSQEYKAKLFLLHVYDPHTEYAFLAKEFHEKKIQEREKELSEFLPPKVRADLDVEVILEKGRPIHHTIVEKAKTLGVDIIVVATHGRTGLAHVLVGSVAAHIIRYAPCPVFVIRNPKEKYLYEWE
jgi:nucleotide-binding universal stress UspA family protein